jgi:hypothetical protein
MTTLGRYWDVQELLQERGIEVSHDTLREWNIKFSPLIAEERRHRKPLRGSRWHMDEVWILSANSSRAAKCGKTRCPGRFALLPIEPIHHAQNVDCGGGSYVLQTGFRQTDISRLS